MMCFSTTVAALTVVGRTLALLSCALYMTAAAEDRFTDNHIHLKVDEGRKRESIVQFSELFSSSVHGSSCR